MIFLKSKEEIEIMRQGGAIVAEVLLKLEEALSPGMTTEDLDRMAFEWIKKAGATSTFIGYQGYPKTLCTSVNEEVVHGIPSKSKVLKEGDIVGIDCGVTYKGFVADHAKTMAVGQVSDENQKLIDDTRKSLQKGMDAFVMGNRIGDIGYAVQNFAEPMGYGIVRDFVGHGVGRKMHEEPQVPNFGTPGTGTRIKVGMVLAIEPMLNLGTHEVKVLKDGWTVITKDRKCAAHFEHSLAMTENGPELLTKV